MRRPFIPLTDHFSEQMRPYQQAGLFMLGCIEREHLLNLEALATYWFRLAESWPFQPVDSGAQMITAPTNSEGAGDH